MKRSEVVEFKKTFASDLNKEIIAFANTSGGEIYIGVDDDGKSIGLDDINDTELRCVSCIKNTVKPDVSLFVGYEHLIFENKPVLKLTVAKGSMAPYYIAEKGILPEGVYVRQGTASVPATRTMIVKMIRETSGEPYEDTRSLNQNLTFIAAKNEFEKAGLPFGEMQKETLGLIGRDNCYTNLALLLSDQCEHKIKFAVFEGTGKEIFKDRHEFSGSLFSQLRDLLRKIDSYNTLSSPKIEGLTREDIRDYPEEAIREAVINAVVHREYALGGYTLVSMFSDRMEIINLGGLPSGVETDDIMMGVSYPRNNRLAEIFYRLQFIEAYGTGILKIENAYAGQERKPAYEHTSNAFKITLPKNENKSRGTSDTVKNYGKEVIEYIKEMREFSRADFQEEFNVSQATASRMIKKLIADGQIDKIGDGMKTKYKVKH